MNTLNVLKKHLRPGRVYRRGELTKWSKSVDRHLKQLQQDGTLTKLSGGIYYRPKNTAFGKAPAEDAKLVKAFLKGNRFLLSSPNAYNALGVGTTQLYNETVVYNKKRHGRFQLGGRAFDFRIKPHFPESLSEGFLLVDLVNNLEQLAEESDALLGRVKRKASSMDKAALAQVVKDYGSVRAKKLFAVALADDESEYAA